MATSWTKRGADFSKLLDEEERLLRSGKKREAAAVREKIEAAQRRNYKTAMRSVRRGGY